MNKKDCIALLEMSKTVINRLRGKKNPLAKFFPVQFLRMSVRSGYVGLRLHFWYSHFFDRRRFKKNKAHSADIESWG